MHIALRLLRDGTRTTITRRFPSNATRRFAAVPDSPQWIDRLDILINNAAQTVHRSSDAYALPVAGESKALAPGPPLRQLGAAHDAHPITALALAARTNEVDAGGLLTDEVDHNSWTQRVQEVDPSCSRSSSATSPHPSS